MNMNILLIEDNSTDVLCLQNAFKRVSGTDSLEVAGNWYKALKVLEDAANDKEKHGPDIILLDLNLPGKNGFEILNELKNNTRWRRIPVVVISTSHNTADVDRAYELQAAGYIVKPSDFVEYDTIARTIVSYWVHMITLPGQKSAMEHEHQR